MASVILDFFSIMGIDSVPPETMAELIPYMIYIFVGVCLVSAVFAVLGKIADVILNISRFR